MLQSGDIISGMYQVIREIGTGGMGVIYIGYHLHLQKQIVIKKIKETCVDRVNVRGEADILKQLRHTYLPQVYDFLEVGNDVYTVMDYIPGENLQYYIDHNYTFPEETILLWMRELCEVLDYLHTRKPRILHSDIKPANIMVTPEGDICLIDFNISLDGSVTQEVQGLSRRYASPEQPQDLDSYLWGNTDKGDDLYVNFRKRTCEGRDGLLAELDVDDTNGYGPETITLNDLNGVYTYSVVDYRTTGTLQQYGATVKVYLPGKSAPTVITLDPNAGVENVWEVFELDHGELKILNRAPAEENLRPGSK